MTRLAHVNDLRIETHPVVGTDLHAGVAFTGPYVTTRALIRVSGVLQARSRAAVSCYVEIQSGWPAGRPWPDDVPPPFAFWRQYLYPAQWLPNGRAQVPATSALDLPLAFTVASSPIGFPLVRLRWVLAAGAGGLAVDDWAMVTAELWSPD